MDFQGAIVKGFQSWSPQIVFLPLLFSPQTPALADNIEIGGMGTIVLEFYLLVYEISLLTTTD